ncbi:MAG: serine/threonine-protein kinase, partial [Pseudomonadota bacterium]
MGKNLFAQHLGHVAADSEFAATVALPLEPGRPDPPPADAAVARGGADRGPGGVSVDILADIPTDLAANAPTDKAGDKAGDVPAGTGSGGGGGGDDDRVSSAPTLDTIGRYELKRQLGVGGLGQVHEAWDPLLSRTVAIKTLHVPTDGPGRETFDRMFLHEARAIASLSHPNIVTVHDAGSSPQGVYIAMERLHGSDLRQRLAEGWRPGNAQAAQLVRRIAEALAYAHARGVVHCDIKPANIFLGERDKPKVLDFGIARVARSGDASGQQGWLAGSPHYMAPEQLRGEAVDPRTDVYALGVVFYELLAGRKAFAGDSVEQISTAVLTNHPAPANALRSGVSPSLALIAAKAMARDPAERHACASALATDLKRWIEAHGKVLPALPASPEDIPAASAGELAAAPARRRLQRPPRAAWLAGSAAAAAVVVLMVWSGGRMAPEASDPPAGGLDGSAGPAGAGAGTRAAPAPDGATAARQAPLVMAGDAPAPAGADAPAAEPDADRAAAPLAQPPAATAAAAAT